MYYSLVNLIAQYPFRCFYGVYSSSKNQGQRGVVFLGSRMTLLLDELQAETGVCETPLLAQ